MSEWLNVRGMALGSWKVAGLLGGPGSPVGAEEGEPTPRWHTLAWLIEVSPSDLLQEYPTVLWAW